jgi:acyl-CoA thioester hydrolase
VNAVDAPAVHVQGMRVYWEDTDAGGVVFYANYLKFFERARTEWLRRLGHSQESMRTAKDDRSAAMFVVTDTQVKYLRPARLDDWIEVDVQVVRRGSASLDIRQRALRGLELLAVGSIRIGCVDPNTLRPRRIPDELQQALDTQGRKNVTTP